MGAIGTAVSVVGGLAGMSQQSSQAAAQRRAIASQEKQQALQAELQYISLKNQSYSDSLTDAINEQTRALAYQQSQTNLNLQQQANNIATEAAQFDSVVQRMSANANLQQAQLQSSQEESDTVVRAGADELASIGEAFGSNNQTIDGLLKQLTSGDNSSTAIANILDMASASGGINEAISLLSGGDVNRSTIAGAALGRQGQLSDARLSNAANTRAATNTLATTKKDVTDSSAMLSNVIATKAADDLMRDATSSQQVANAGFNATRAANEATNTIGILSDKSASESRKYLTAANLRAVEQGAALQSDILNAQKSQIKSPSFFDYAGLALKTYNSTL